MAVMSIASVYAQNPPPQGDQAVDVKAAKQAKKADDKAARKDRTHKNQGWEFFTLVFMPGSPSSSDHAITNGVRLGAPISAGANGIVRGFEPAVISCLTRNVQGLQASPFFCSTEVVDGVQFSLVNYSEEANGLQLGVVNYAEDCAFQFGLVNMIENGFFPFFPIVNVSF